MKVSISSILAILYSFANAHVMMNTPPSRKSKYSEYYVNNNLVDYNIMAPLNTPGYSFPCKGFSKGPSTAKIYSNTISVTLEGSAIHGGGHCQFGISYDDVNYIVLKSVIRTCLIDGMSYDIQLPDNIPSGDVTFFWSWVNAIGNREYYMECADVSIFNNLEYINEPIVGNKLVVLNMPGFPIIPEFPNLDMYDGSEYILNSPTCSISPTKQQDEQVQNEISTCAEQDNGNMKCDGELYDVCSHGQWIKMECAPGTACKQTGYSIICDWK